jgi:hypothetical protein
MDFIIDLPPTKGFDSMFVVIDRFSKATIVSPCCKDITAEGTSQLYLEQVLLRPLSYLGAARPLMLPLSRLLPYVYLSDRSTAYTGLTSGVAAISMLSSYRPNPSTSVRTMPTFLFRLAFSRLSNHSLASCYESSPVFVVRVSQFFRYLLRLFCYLLSTILHISQPISKLLTHLLTVL